MNRLATDESLTVLCLAKGCHRWIILADEAHLGDVVIALRDWSVNPLLDFDAADANRVLLKMRQDADYRMECEGR